MRIAAMTFRLHAPWVHSLKEKRMVVKSLTARLQNRFHVSAAEISEQDVHQIIVLGVAAIVPHNAMADSLMDSISSFVEEKRERARFSRTRWRQRSLMKRGRSDKRMQSTSKFISLILRHKPQVIGITLDEHGWADVQELIGGINRAEGHLLDMNTLEEIVRRDEKQRYSFNEDHSLIRANQGHSIPVDVELEEMTPPDVLWHGTGEKYVPSIDVQGLLPKSRLYVHLSSDMETARKVGSRHGRPVIYEIDCRQMVRDGFRFFLSANHVWLTKEVPVTYLRKAE